jgi:pyridoxal 5'-phosphate synthase pdxS subunit
MSMENERYRLNAQLAQMLKGGVIMDVTTSEQASIAQEAGAVAVMALERVPSDIRKHGGVARMCEPAIIMGIKEAVTIPVMAKARIGHFMEAQILQELKVDYIDESEVLTPADEECHIDKTKFNIPFVCGARNLGEALRRIAEGAAMIRTKGEAGTGNVVEAVRHMRAMNREVRQLVKMPLEEVTGFARANGIPYELALEVRKLGRLPVVNFAAGGLATPADAALMMQLGCDGVFVGSAIFKSEDPAKRGHAIVKATAHFNDPAKLLEASMDLGEAMPGLEISSIPEKELLAGRGW